MAQTQKMVLIVGGGHVGLSFVFIVGTSWH